MMIFADTDVVCVLAGKFPDVFNGLYYDCLCLELYGHRLCPENVSTAFRQLTLEPSFIQ